MQDEVQGFSLQKVREWLEKHGWVPCASEQDCVMYADKAGRVVWVPESLGAGVSGREQRRIFSDTLKTLAPLAPELLESVCEG